jgi:tRNA (guanine37-N1)-methyltransferase
MEQPLGTREGFLLLNVSSNIQANEGRSLKKKLLELLSQVLSPEELSRVYGSFDIVGDIAIIRLSNASHKNAKKIADALMEVHGNVKTVLAQTSAVGGEFRIRSLTHITGENRTRTVHKESGCIFSVDLDKCYFSPRLSHERLRIATLVKPDETVLNMFAGVGCFSIIIVKQANSARVFSIDINPTAIKLMHENIRLNKTYGQVIPLLGDAKTIIERQLKGQADRVLMPLPEKALECLPAAVSALKPSGGWVHIYVFKHATKTESPVEKVRLKVAEELARLNMEFEIPLVRVVRRTGPNWFQLVADVHLSSNTVT